MTKLTQNILLILITFIFSIACRMIWVYQFDSMDYFKHNDVLMINTNDGYFFAEGARDIIAGFHQENDLSPINEALSIVTAIAAKVFPFESVLLYLSSVLSSLIVVPIFLIGLYLKDQKTGFIAALLSSIALSYYNRTMSGYYDTDMLNIVFPMIGFYFLIRAIKEDNLHFAFLFSLNMMLNLRWYYQSYAISFAFCLMLFVFLVFIFFYKKWFNFDSVLKLVVLSLLANVRLEFWINIALVCVIYFAFLKLRFNRKTLFCTLFIVLALFFVQNLDNIWHHIKLYVVRQSFWQSGSKLSFFTSHQTVSEASKIGLDMLSYRISGSAVGFIVSFVGVCLLILKRPIFLFSLPMLGLGFLALNGGLRFTIYAVPVMSLGFGYIVSLLSDKIKSNMQKKLFLIIATCLVLIPNILHIKEYKISPVFYQEIT